MEMKVFFATNRNLEIGSDNSVMLSPAQNLRFGIRPDLFRIGTAKVEISKYDEIEGERLNDEAKYICTSAQLAKETYCTEKRAYTVRGSEEIFPQLLKEVRNKEGSKKGVRCSVLVFIHGFDNSFEESIATGAKLAHLYSSNAHQLIPFVFSWPSDGEFSNIYYGDDRIDAELSGCAGARLLACFFAHLWKLRRQDNSCSLSAYLITHSMGAYLLRFAVQNLQWMSCQVSQIFDATILTAPDVDTDVFEKANKLLPLNKLTKEIVVYVNKTDKALSAAKHQLNGSPRMGLSGPGAYASPKLGVPLTIVRCNEVDFDYEDTIRHWYYRRSIAVIKDIKAVLSGEDPDKICYRDEVQPTGRDIYRYRLAPPKAYLNRLGTQEPREEDEA